MMQVLKMTRARLKENKDPDLQKRLEQFDAGWHHEYGRMEIIQNVLEVGNLGTKTDEELRTMLDKSKIEKIDDDGPNKLDKEMIDWAISALQKLRRVVRSLEEK